MRTVDALHDGSGLRPVRVLVVDDSAMIRRVLTMGLESGCGITVVGEASHAAGLPEMIERLRPDVLTLDLEMPRLDGLTFLREMMKRRPMPVVVISSRTGRGERDTIRALEAGAVAVIPKPTMGVGSGLGTIMGQICDLVRGAAGARAAGPGRVLHRPSDGRQGFRADWVLGIGISTGGVQALGQILPAFPVNSPPLLITQHMPAGYTRSFAQRLDGLCRLRVREAADGELLVPGTAYVAPGGERHMGLRRDASGRYRIRLIEGPPVSFSRPSVDVLFGQIAEATQGSASAVLMTGMGRDGAAGLLEIRRSGGRTFTQDEASCVVFGMPFAAQQIGASERAVALAQIPGSLLDSVPPAGGACPARHTPNQEI
ncbi:chemotaxis response regulator protein-glutamate methylesterase [Plastorhodobacter daqingensis]|uniref:Protein-glutamate methylesterase/protein-glutamine glutaminase n=1 Tax=Plastorhodobacter daqingensis TaxID=1387281 RepID=A0ABW2UG30_9RHOB